MKRVFVCSPFRGVVEANKARAMCRVVLDEGNAPFAPHLIYPEILDDNLEEERELGIKAGLAFLDSCDEIMVYAGAPPSLGMQREIVAATAKGKQVTFWGFKS